MGMHADLVQQFDLSGRVALVTGGSGALGRAMARGLAMAGARVALLARRPERLQEAVAEIEQLGGEALALPGDVLDRASLEKARETLLSHWDRLDILVNGAGGNVREATLEPGHTVFELTEEAFRRVIDLNLMGTILPTLIFGEVMARQRRGVIVNVSSMAATRILTRVVGYSAAKAAVENFTRWMAVELARTYGEGLRVNAIAPGFFLGEQNRHLLLREDGSLTERGQAILAHTPMGRFGEADDLIGTLVWLCSDASRFVTGVVVPVDGGFSIYTGI
ncbi:SDR family oxidoreductase [Rhodothermus marinus]|uniref:Short-chain dehydrogenase/reductase SDR n=1 Tax=Rhodothermus marinus (strain ATCC 43812 / DSM 4252 / R-10) TaxID=518766 RepID=D0MIV6_RHOM4|nr:SDR family oxidoreductase [Rhodothermus marinus]ACY48414.1 short-chain dehydrogenase/reductase SDR [Rhodothermus marinus DSM 4252]MBO2491198.1 SDR family oxidoreductase [Rhodothermus marinus]